MEIEFAVEFTANKDKTSKWGIWSSAEILAFCSNEYGFNDWIDFDAGFMWEHEKLEGLEDGDYWVFARGVAYFDSSVDWEYGIEEGSWLLNPDIVVVKKLDNLPEMPNYDLS